MSRRAYVEIDLDHFDDDEIIAEADRILERRGRGLGDRAETCREALQRLVSDLAAAIAGGSTPEALSRLNDLLDGDRGLLDAADVGARRRR